MNKRKIKDEYLDIVINDIKFGMENLGPGIIAVFCKEDVMGRDIETRIDDFVNEEIKCYGDGYPHKREDIDYEYSNNERIYIKLKNEVIEELKRSCF